jgi:uridylate kinase
MADKVVVMSLGGSLIIPDRINISYLKNFSKAIHKLVKKGYRFVIVTGGGKPARDYINTFRMIKCSEYDCGWVGILATRVNAFLVSGFLKTGCKVPEHLKEVKHLIKKHKIVVCAGFKPGMTSDGDAANIAKMLKTGFMINLTNVNGLYNKDPRKFKNANLIPNISSKDFLKIMKKIGHKPGQNFVLDLEAAKVCYASNMKIFIMNGNNLRNFENLVLNKKFFGTVIG